MTAYFERPESDDVFALECAIRDFEVDMKEANFMYEMVEMRDQLNRDRADAKVFRESGTIDDLMFLYTEAGTSSSEKSGILSTIIGKIGEFFKKIIDSIKKFLGFRTAPKSALEQTIDVFMDTDVALGGNITGEIRKAVDNLISLLQQLLSTTKGKVMAGLGAAVAGTAFGVHKHLNKKDLETANTVTGGGDTGKASDASAADGEEEETAESVMTESEAAAKESKGQMILGRIEKAKNDLLKMIENKFGGKSDDGEKKTVKQKISSFFQPAQKDLGELESFRKEIDNLDNVIKDCQKDIKNSTLVGKAIGHIREALAAVTAFLMKKAKAFTDLIAKAGSAVLSFAKEKGSQAKSALKNKFRKDKTDNTSDDEPKDDDSDGDGDDFGESVKDLDDDPEVFNESSYLDELMSMIADL